MQAGKLYAATESFLPFEIELSRDYLRPVGFTTIGGMLEQKVHIILGRGVDDLCKVGPKEGTFSAHPRIDPVTGQMYFFSGMFVQVLLYETR